MSRRTVLGSLVCVAVLSACSLLSPAPVQQPGTAAPAPTSAAPPASPVGSVAAPAQASTARSSPAIPTPSPTATPTPSPTRTQVLATDVIDTTGIGPLKLGLPLSVLKERGDVVAAPTGDCTTYNTGKALRDMGLELVLYGKESRLGAIHVSSSLFQTRSGARVGMTVAQVRKIYGSNLAVETKQGNGGPFEVLTIRDGGREVLFMIPWDSQPVSDADRIDQIVTREYSNEMFGGC